MKRGRPGWALDDEYWYVQYRGERDPRWRYVLGWNKATGLPVSGPEPETMTRKQAFHVAGGWGDTWRGVVAVMHVRVWRRTLVRPA